MIDFRQILDRYKPTEAQNEEIRQIAEGIISRTEQSIRKAGVKAKALLVGSVAKGTNLASGDLDIFVVFSKEYSRREMERVGLRIGHEVIRDGTEKYAEHPYVSGYMGSRKIDIVPCFEIDPNTRIISSVDRTPLHTQYVLQNLDQEGRDQVRLLKLFMKSIGVYGSEIKVSGFSGYVCELLIIKYGSMLKTLEAFSRTRGQMVVPFNGSDTSSFKSPVIIIDPTDLTRNAAAAISVENFARMKICSRMFMEEQDPKFFDAGRSYSAEKFRDRGTAARIFTIAKLDLIDDILFSQAVRFRNIIVQILDEEGFYPMASEVDISDTIEVLVECKLSTLPGTRVHQGPPVDAANAMDFIRKWSGAEGVHGPYVCGDRLCADVPVQTRTIEDVVRSRINGFNIGKNIDELKNGMEIVDPVRTKKEYRVVGKFYSRSISQFIRPKKSP